MRISSTWIIVSFAVLLLGCGAAMAIKMFGKKDVWAKVSFREVRDAAEYAAAAYENEEDNKSKLGEDGLDIDYLDGTEIKFLVKTLKNEHWISVRGTANAANAKVDATYIKERDEHLGVYLHEGFGYAAKDIYAKVKPLLNPEYKINVTGHSLGGAIAAILMMHLDVDQFQLNTCYTFGQPKVTNHEGVEKFRHLPLVRVVDNEDVVPLVPPLTIISALHGAYRHFGSEVILKDGGHFIFLPEHDAERMIVSSTWLSLFHESVEDHYMKNYIAHIDPLLANETTKEK